MFKLAVSRCYSIFNILFFTAVLYFCYPVNSYASAKTDLPDSAIMLMIAVPVAGVLILTAFIIFVYRTSKKNRRS